MRHSKYTEYPSLVVFLFMAVLTAAYFSIMPPTPDGVGFFLILWSLFAFIRVLWLAECLGMDPYVDKAYRSKVLPWIILTTMQRHKRVSRGNMALKTMGYSFVALMFLAGLYIALMVASNMNLNTNEDYQQLRMLLLSYFSTEEFSQEFLRHSYGHYQLLNFSKFAIIAIAFWATMTYSYSQRLSEIILWTFAVIFLMTALKLLPFLDFSLMSHFPSGDLLYGYGWGHTDTLRNMSLVPQEPMSVLNYRIYELGLLGMAALCMMGLLAVGVLVYGIVKGRDNRRAGVIGLLILSVMVIMDVFSPYNIQLLGLWFSGWVCLAVLWVRTRAEGKKIYSMRQI